MTNLFTNPEDFSNVAWSKSRCSVVANGAVAPDGTTTADSIVDTTNNNTHILFQDNFDLSTSKTISVFANADELSQVSLHLDTTGKMSVLFDLATLAVVETTNTEGTILATSAEDYSPIMPGWVRLRLSGVNSLGPDDRAGFGTGSGDTQTYAGNGTDGVYLWGADLREGAELVDYTSVAGTTISLSKSKGRSAKKRRREFVEIGDQFIEVFSPEEADELRASLTKKKPKRKRKKAIPVRIKK